MAACAPCCACRPSGTRQRTRCAPPPCCAPVICTAAFSRRKRNRSHASPQPAAMPKYEDMTEAEQYAVIYPDRAAAIRRHGGMPPGAKYPPPDDAVFTEIVTGNSPVFLALDAEHAAEAVAESEISSHTTTP